MNNNQGEFVYDLISTLRKNPTRANKVTAAIKHLDTVTKAYAEGKASHKDILKAEAAVIPASGFNFGLLVPRCFPRFPYESPLDLSTRPFMFVMTTLAPGSVVTLKAGRQVGKCVDGATEVQTAQGPCTLASLFVMATPN